MQHDSKTTPAAASESVKPAETQQPGDEPAAPAPQAAQAEPKPGAAEHLAAEVEKLKGQVGDLTDRLLRAHAEMDNIRKRAEREKADTARYAITKFANDVVNVSDNFERAIQSVPAGAADAPAVKSLLEGVSMTERELLNVLERHGVKRIDPKGEAFNPHLHQAVMEMQNAEVAAGTVVQVYQCGYLIEDRVLRPAMVVVAKGGFKPVKAPEAAQSKPANDAGPAAGDQASATASEPKPASNGTAGA